MDEVQIPKKQKTHRRLYHGGLFWPVIIITIGVLFLLKNLSILTGDISSTLLQLWPLLLILIGLDNILQGHGLAGPVFLIGLGIIFLLDNFGHLPWSAWDLILRLWPVLIIAIGLDIFLGRRSAWGSLLALILMLAILTGALWLVDMGTVAEPNTFKWKPDASISHIDANLSPAVGSLRVNFLPTGDSWAEGSLLLQKSEDINSQMLSDGTFTIKTERGKFFSPVGKAARWKWDINFSPKIPIDIKVNMGVGEIELNLGNLDVNQLDANLGIGKITIILPKQTLRGKVNCAIGETVIVLPRGSEAQFKVDSGITAVNVPSGFSHNGDLYISAGYNTSGAIRIDLEVDQAIGNLRVEYEK